MTTVDPLERLPTEVPGLDAVLRGGLIKASLCVVEGPPGAGKTVLANQVAHRHAARGGQVLYVTLVAESHHRMMQSLRGMAFFDPALVPSALRYVSGHKTLADEGAQGLATLLHDEIRAGQVSLLVLDGLSLVGELVGGPAGYQSFLHGLQARADASGCTALLLANPSPGPGSGPGHTLVDGWVELAHLTDGMRAMRSLQVDKSRGSDHLTGLHHFGIDGEGITVHPRLDALLSRPTALGGAPTGRLPTGVAGLDAMLGGGLPAASVTIVLGPSGAGKTTLALHFLGAATPERPAVLLGFSETPLRLRERARRMGLDLAGLEAAGAVELLWQPPLGANPDELGHRLLDHARRRGTARVVVDGLGGFEQVAFFPDRLPLLFTALANELRGAGVTALCTAETPDLLGPERPARLPPYAGATDNIVLMRFAEREGWLRRLLSVLKLRDGDFDHAVREFAVGAGGVRVAAGPDLGDPTTPTAAG